jgi:hypothetical protein
MSDASSFSGLDARLERLEGQVRSLKRLLVIALVGIVAAFGAGAAGAAQKAFTIVDSGGHTRVKIDETGFQLYDTAGRRRILLGMDKYGKPAMFFGNEAGYYPLQAYISPKNVPVFYVADAKGNGRAYFGLTSDQHQPRIEFDDEKSNERLYVGLTKDSTGIVRTYTASGANQTSLEDDKVWVTDANGNNRIYLGTSSSGDGILRMYDSGTRERIYAGVFTDETSGFQSMDSGGNVTWSSTSGR